MRMQKFVAGFPMRCALFVVLVSIQSWVEFAGIHVGSSQIHDFNEPKEIQTWRFQ